MVDFLFRRGGLCNIVVIVVILVAVSLLSVKVMLR